MKQTILSSKQNELLERLTVKYGQIVTIEQVYEAGSDIGNKISLKKMLTRLVANGWLMRIKRGQYVISDFSNRGFLSLSPYVIASLLVKDSYVSFESALSYHGMFDQLTNSVISISKKQYKAVKLGGTEYSFVSAKDGYCFGWVEAVIDGGIARVATPEKALIDMVQFHKSKYSVDLVIEKLRGQDGSLNLKKLCEEVSRMSITTIKVFGFILDLLNINSDDLYALVRLKLGTHWMITGDKKFNAKWRLYYDEYFDKYK